MSNETRFVAKNGLQSQNLVFVSPDRAKKISASMLDSDTISFSGDSGQLFSITDSMTGTIFAVNDISGIPSIEVDDTGTIRLAETFGNVLIGTATDNGNKLQVNGTISANNVTVTNTVSANTVSANNFTATGTITANLFSGKVLAPELLDDISGLTDSDNAVFTMRIAGVPVINTYIIDSKDLQVTVDGKRLQPYTEDGDFIFMPAYDAYKGFRVRENRVIIYNAPEVGSQISLVAQNISTTKQIRRYPFSATNIAFGD